MKKLLLLILLFIPFMVQAKSEFDQNKVYITKIEKYQKSDEVEELSAPTFSGKTLNVDLRMRYLNDYMTYKVTVKNDNDEPCELDTSTFKANSPYMEYQMTYDNTNVIGAKSEKIFYLKVIYKTEVPDSSYTGGVYRENKELKFDIKIPEVTNPKTGVVDPTRLFIIMCLASLLLYIALRKNNYIRLNLFIIFLLLIIPISLYALNKIEFTFNSKVELVKEPSNTVFVDGRPITGLVQSQEYCYKNLTEQEQMAEGKARFIGYSSDSFQIQMIYYDEVNNTNNGLMVYVEVVTDPNTSEKRLSCGEISNINTTTVSFNGLTGDDALLAIQNYINSMDALTFASCMPEPTGPV